jgi:hypothetical protein
VSPPKDKYQAKCNHPTTVLMKKFQRVMVGASTWSKSCQRYQQRTYLPLALEAEYSAQLQPQETVHKKSICVSDD